MTKKAYKLNQKKYDLGFKLKQHIENLVIIGSPKQ